MSVESVEFVPTAGATPMPVTPALTSWVTLWRPLLAASTVALVTLYGVAFAESPLAHNAAHDVRHVTVKPCH